MGYDSYRSKGYDIVPAALSAVELAMLRDTCDTLTSEQNTSPAPGEHDISVGTRRQFLAKRHGDFPALAEFLLRGTAARLAQEYSGQEEVYLFNEQFVVKGASNGAPFAWHQDGAYVGFDHTPYLSVWIALDDVSTANGCVRVLPRDLRKDEVLVPHFHDHAAKEKVGYNGSDPGVPAEGPAGTAVMFSSTTLHCSGDNLTDQPRRAYLAQYSVEPICLPDTGKIKNFAEPVFAR